MTNEQVVFLLTTVKKRAENYCPDNSCDVIPSGARLIFRGEEGQEYDISMTSDSEHPEILKLISSGQLKLAMKKARQATRKNPKNPNFHNLLGIILGSEGKFADAASAFAAAVKLAPGFADARANLARTFLMIGKPDKALSQFDILCAGSPTDHAVHYGRSQALFALRDLTGAEQAITTALQIAPQEVRYLTFRARVREASGDTQGMLGDYAVATQLAPDDPDVLTEYSLPLARNLRGDDALELLRHAVSVAPAHAPAHLRLGMQLLEVGDMDGAREAFSETLRCDPMNGYAFENLVSLQSSDQNRELLANIKDAIHATPQAHENFAPLSFALAHIAGQDGNETLMRDALAQANRALARKRPYDAKADSAYHTLIMQRSLPSTVALNEGPYPVFIAGLPRSGTTLVETLLAAHPDLMALGEQAAAGIHLDPLLTGGAPFGPSEAAEFANRYRRTIPVVPDTVAAFTDKMPENYRYLGFLKSAMPDARLILVHRDPRDIALSMWRTHFSGAALNYTYDLSAMAHRFNLFAKMVAHWDAVMPGAVLHIRYEDLVSDIEAGSRQLATFCGLDWRDEMAHPESATVPVMTRSAAQVRQAAHTRSVGKWVQHKDMLHPFVKRLDPDLWPDVQNA